MDWPVWLAVHGAGLVGLGLSNITGIGAALVLVPVLTLAVGAQSAVALMAPVLLCNSAVKWWVFRHQVDRSTLKVLLGTALPSAVVGAACSSMVPNGVLGRVMGVTILTFVVVQWRGRATALHLGTTGVAVMGTVTGLISGLTSAGGPTTSMALQARGLTKEALIGTGAVVGVALQLVKMPVYGLAGTLNAQQAPLVLTLGVCAAAAGLVGRKVVAGMDVRTFQRVLLTALAVLGVVMLLQ